MRPLKEKISITLDENLLLELRERAEQDDRSLSQYINLILKEYILHHPQDQPSNKKP